MQYESICIFTPTGRTYTFKNVEILCDNETVLAFRYRAMSDGRDKTATFPKNTLCGWSLLEQQPEPLIDELGEMLHAQGRR